MILIFIHFLALQDSIVDASEDSQIQEALRKSVEETKARSEPILPDLTDDDSLSENDDLETFSDSDADNQSLSGTPVKKPNGTKSGSATNGSKSSTTTKTAESGDSVMEKQSQVLNKTCSELAENGKSSAKSVGESSSASDEDKSCEHKSTWKDYLGNSKGTQLPIKISGCRVNSLLFAVVIILFFNQNVRIGDYEIITRFISQMINSENNKCTQK